MLQALDLVVLE